jgi:hypothetical protein
MPGRTPFSGVHPAVNPETHFDSALDISNRYIELVNIAVPRRCAERAGVGAGADRPATYTPRVRRHVDYALARRAVLGELRAGKRDRLDVCDAQPELLRAARNIGEPLAGDCPVCGSTALVLVSYVYGDALRRANGRCIDAEELARLDAAHEEFSRYVVEVCPDCHWNHLQRRELHGRRHAG